MRVRIRTAVGTGLLLSPSEWWARCVYEVFFRIRIRYLLEIASAGQQTPRAHQVAFSNFVLEGIFD